LFGQGNFEIPKFVRDQKPRGASVMQPMKGKMGKSGA
jgi:hypothetical protein